jgi:hypothetical protein
VLEAATILERIDRVLAELRAVVAASLPPAEVEGLSHRTTNLPDDADDPAAQVAELAAVRTDAPYVKAGLGLCRSIFQGEKGPERASCAGDQHR